MSTPAFQPFFTLFNSPHAPFIDNLKLKKQIKVLLVRFDGTLLYNVHEKALRYKCSCKDRVIGGKITYQHENQSIEYRKRFSLPVVGNKLGCLVAAAKWSYNPGLGSWEPAFRFGFEFRQGGAEMVQMNSVRIKPRLFYKNIGLEAVTQVTLQMPSKLLFEAAIPPSGVRAVEAGPGGEDDDAWGVKLDVQQLNLVVKL